MSKPSRPDSLRAVWRIGLAPLALAAALAVPPIAALAQTTGAQPATTSQNVRRAEDLRIRGFDVQAVDRLGPGSELEFSLWGTPGATASVRIDGARRLLTLSERSPGYYAGTYVVSGSDAVTPGSRAVAQLRAGRYVSTAVLDETLQAGFGRPEPAIGAAPEIESATANRAAQRNGTQQVDFTVIGSPGATASVVIPGARPRNVFLEERRRGEYFGSYVVRAGDRFNAERPAVVRLRLNDRVATATVPQAFEGLRFTSDRPVACADCGTVQSIQPIEVDGDEGYVGAVTGGVLGAVLGSQVGGGDGRKAAGVAGAVGGALIGRQLDKKRARRTQYEVVVRMRDGESRTFTYAEQPPFQAGQQIRVEGGTLKLI